MDRSELERLIATGMTVREIAAHSGKGYSTVRYWLGKHGLIQLGAAGLTRSLESMRAEAAKCVLLCSNCHAEIEGGFASLV